MLLQAARPISFGAVGSPSHAAPSPGLSSGSSHQHQHQHYHRSPSASSDAVSMPPPPPHTSTTTTATNRRRPPPPHVQQLVDALTHQRANTMTALCRLERRAAACAHPDDARALQAPMTRAWARYVTSHQLLSELRGLTRGFPASAALVAEAHRRVRADPASNRSWNLAWLCLARMRDDDGLIATYAVEEASRPDMWGGMLPAEEDVLRLSGCFSREWTLAVAVLLKHWPVPPTWY
ncbi:hypothetical protein A9K55_002546 [Cordyceps militaris]|uniref:Uncharacterized protein n=1 Tax=Cordyceps militaris TaxID=73501 RepID=A0A2H4S7G3_CORMI|nr:hypothetical protein A9K55_002546 [Cordyceps militaris]